MSTNLCSTKNPRKWRFTWEAQSYTPTLRLFLFNPYTKPSTQCQNLKVHLNLSQSLVLVTWFEDLEVSLRVPIPRVLVDSESPVSFRALDDHIEVKLVLLLPVDHPIISSFDSMLNLSEGEENARVDALKPLDMDSDLKILSASGGVHFYCRSCSFKLTKSPLRHFVEMPSVNWREVADNWFGTCCCSFGGISEKLVTGYVNSYTCETNICQLSSTIITLCKDDLVEWKFSKQEGCQQNESQPEFNVDKGLSEASLDSGSNHGKVTTCVDPSDETHASDGKSRSMHFRNEDVAANFRCRVTESETNDEASFCLVPESDFSEYVASAPGCCLHVRSHVLNHVDEDCTNHVSETKEIQANQSQPDFNVDKGLSEASLDSGSNHGRVITCVDPSDETHASDGKSRSVHFRNENVAANYRYRVTEAETNDEASFCLVPESDFSEDVASAPGCCLHVRSPVLNHADEDCTNHVSETKEIQANQKPFLNGFLGNVFMVRDFNLSADVEWIEYVCPQCSSLLGAYPYGNGYAPVDFGVRFFKCYVSTCLPVDESRDLFRKYTLGRMFTNQLLESANDESSYRTVVRDLKTKSPLLQIVLLNPNSWSCSGYCLGTEGSTELVPKMDLHPVIKVLFSDCSNSTESQSRLIEDWQKKNSADEVFMLTYQIKELIKSLVLTKNMLPPSYSCLQGLSLSSLQR